jgi:hypothetical protein
MPLYKPLLLKLAALSLGLFVAGPSTAQTTGSSGGSYTHNGDDHEHTSYRDEFPLETHNPDAAEQKRLRVLWGRAAMGHFDRKQAQGGGQRVWIESEKEAEYNCLGIRGCLQIVSEDGKSEKPVDWCQGVRIVLGRLPSARPDWSKRHDMKDSAWNDGIIEKDGSFLIALSPEEIRRPVGGAGIFQVALCLGTKSGNCFTWKNSAPVLAQSVSTVRITGPQPLSPTLQAINGAPSVHAQDFNPVMLIRAVNHLHSLGKDKAIAELRRFLKIARWSDQVARDPANIDTSDYQCVFLIVRLLFTPAEPGEKLPWMYIGAMIPSPPKGDLSWPLFPLALHEDVPFMLIHGVSLGGAPENPAAHVDWAEKHGRLRAKPLRPSDNPLAAVESLCALPQTQRLLGRASNAWGMDLLRRQAWRTVEDVVRQSRTAMKEPFGLKDDARLDWEQCKKTVQGLKIRWDVAKQAYVADYSAGHSRMGSAGIP